MQSFRKLRVAVIGCGMICDTYFENMLKFDVLDVVGCADLRPERSEAKARQYGIRQMTDEEIWADESIDLVVNLTWTTAHYEVSRKSLLAGKHVYSEKMTTLTCEESTELLRIAAEKGLTVGGAPDTFFGGGAQQARRILDSGLIGTPTMASVVLSNGSYRQERSYEGDYKRFSFCPGGGIIYDMGCYYLTQLVFLLGAVRTVSGFTATRDPHRTWMNPKSALYGTPMEIESCNVGVGSLLFENGVLGSVSMTSEGGGWDNHFRVYCTDGYIDLKDPNFFHGDVTVVNRKSEHVDVPANFGLVGSSLRGSGVAEMAYAILEGRPPRCSGELNRHVLEIARAIDESSAADGAAVRLRYGCPRPEPLPIGQVDYPELAFRTKF